MNILNIFNNLVTLSTPHNPTHTLPKQPQCSYKYNVYQYVVPTLQGNPPMSAASEESTAGFSPEAPQTGKKGGRAAGAGERHRKSRTRTPQSRKRTGITRNWTRKSENRQGKPGEQAGKARCRRGRHSESEVKRIGQGQKKGNPESGLHVRHPQFPHQPKTTNLNEP